METEIVRSADIGELRSKTEQALKLSQENNHILHKMRFWGRVSFWAKVVLWAVVLLLPVVFYSYLAPLAKLVPGAPLSAPNSATGR